jgi:heterodisulfide reductase subunit B
MSKENKNLNEAENSALNIADVICCGALEELDIRWMYLADQTKCMPHIKNIQQDKDFRVNFCPVCGINVRSVMLKP